MKNLMAALLKAQQEFPTLVKDSNNPAFRSKYASLGAVQETAFPILAKHGLVVLQSVRTDLLEDGRLIVYVGGMLYHVESGEDVKQEVGMVPKDATPQAVGSATTYGRRYLLMTMLGLVPDDDDGNAASQSSRSPYTDGLRAAAQKQPPPPPAEETFGPATDTPPWVTWGANPNAALDWATTKGLSMAEAKQLLAIKKGDAEGGRYNSQTAPGINQAFWLAVMDQVEPEQPPLVNVPAKKAYT